MLYMYMYMYIHVYQMYIVQHMYYSEAPITKLINYALPEFLECNYVNIRQGFFQGAGG